MLQGIDTSYVQGEVDWIKAKASGISFAYMRACYGSNPYDDDPNFDSNHDAAKAAGLDVGCYFFYLASEDPFAQVQHFLSRIAGREGTLRPCVDVEEGSFKPGFTNSPTVNIRQLAAVSATLQKALHGKLPVIYTDQDTWATFFDNTNAFSGHPLWVASYGTAGKPAMPGGWGSWAIHQYDQGGTVEGVNGTTDLDCAPDLTPVKL